MRVRGAMDDEFRAHRNASFRVEMCISYSERPVSRSTPASEPARAISGAKSFLVNRPLPKQVRCICGDVANGKQFHARRDRHAFSVGQPAVLAMKIVGRRQAGEKVGRRNGVGADEKRAGDASLSQNEIAHVAHRRRRTPATQRGTCHLAAAAERRGPGGPRPSTESAAPCHPSTGRPRSQAAQTGPRRSMRGPRSRENPHRQSCPRGGANKFVNIS